MFISAIIRKGWEPRFSLSFSRREMLDDLRNYFNEMAASDDDIPELSEGATEEEIIAGIEDQLNETVLIDEQLLPRIQIVANISGGVLQGASANVPGVEIYTLDFDDVPNDDPENVIEVDGDEAYLGQCSAEHDEKFVRAVIEAKTLASQFMEGLPKITDDKTWFDLKEGEHAQVRGRPSAVSSTGFSMVFPDWSEIFIEGDGSSLARDGNVIIEVERTKDGLKFIRQLSGF